VRCELLLINGRKNYLTLKCSKLVLKCRFAYVCVGLRSVASGGYTIAQCRRKREGWTDSWRERKLDVSIGRKVQKVFTKRVLVVRHLSMPSLMGVLSFLGHSKFEGLTRCRSLNHEGVDTILVTLTH
jgi:hypothetical protein